jgi:hypothetical protein
MAKEMDLNTLDAAPAAKAGPHADQPHRLSAAKRTRPAHRKAEPRNASATHSKVLAAADIAVKAFIDAEEYGESADNSARLLAHAESQMHGLVSNIKRHPLTSVTARSWMNRLADIQSMVEGAAAVDKDRSRANIASGLLKTLGGIVNTLDATDWPHESDDEHHARDFMAGKALAADMIEEAEAIATEGRAELEASLRGRDVPQDLFVAKYLEAVNADTSLAQGFEAGLSGNLVATCTGGNLSGDFVRQLTVDECHGSPDTKYMAEENETPGDRDAAKPDRVDIEFAEKARAVLKAVSQHAANAMNAQGCTGVSRRLLTFARLIASAVAEDETADRARIEDCLANTNALIVGASWSPGSVKGCSAIFDAFDLLQESGLLSPLGEEQAPKQLSGALRLDELSGWRIKAHEMLAEAGTIIREASDLDQGGTWAETGMLLCRAETVRSAMVAALLDIDSTRDSAQYESYELVALLRGAKGLDVTPRAVRLLLQEAIELIDAATNENGYLDGPGADDLGHTRSDGGVATPRKVMARAAAAVSGAAHSASVLWQMAMDELTNADPSDAEEEVTKAIELLAAMKPHLVGMRGQGTASS